MLKRHTQSKACASPSIRFVIASCAILMLLTFAGIVSAAPAQAVADRVAILASARIFFLPESNKGAPEFGALTERFPYATVRFSAELEGERSRGVLLYRHYDFGWQLIALSLNQIRECELATLAIREQDLGALVAVSSDLPRERTSCSRLTGADAKSVSQDETAVRARMGELMTDEAIPSVRIRNGFALVVWEGHGGGIMVFAKRANRWRHIGGGGGAISTGILASYGIPARSARQLMNSSQW